jgi:hypothetical protein
MVCGDVLRSEEHSGRCHFVLMSALVPLGAFLHVVELQIADLV